jgi:prepilin-type N-terminal cleavage/methylation domain-containing protein
MAKLRSRCRTALHCRGFTLIELLSVVTIISILAAIALPVYQQYRAEAYDARAIHDLGNLVNAQEAYYATNEVYVTFTVVGPATIPVPGLAVSDTVTLDAIGGALSFEATAVSSRGTGKTFHFDSITDTFVSN